MTERRDNESCRARGEEHRRKVSWKERHSNGCGEKKEWKAGGKKCIGEERKIERCQWEIKKGGRKQGFGEEKEIKCRKVREQRKRRMEWRGRGTEEEDKDGSRVKTFRGQRKEEGISEGGKEYHAKASKWCYK
jgi:hypothetical protein